MMKWGLIGCGDIVMRRVAPALREIAGCEIDALARRHPDHLAARLNLGALLLELKRPQEAISHLEAAARLAPREAATWSPLARAREALGQRDPAIEAYRRLLRIKSDQLGPAANTDPEYQHAQARLRAMGATP